MQKRNAYRVLMVKHEGKKPTGIPRHKFMDDIKIDPKETWAT
jgi:hypothetical protein